MRRNRKIVYLVEGENEKTMIDCIKNTYVVSGRVSVFNVTSKKLTKSKIRTYAPNTTVVLVFDTDVCESINVSMLIENIRILQSANNVEEVILIPQVKNFEDELMRSTNISKITDFTNSKSKSDFKRDFNKLEKDLLRKLQSFDFNIDLLWSESPPGAFSRFSNSFNRIKTHSKYRNI